MILIDFFKNGVVSISHREKEIIDLMSQGYTSKDIAEKLGISELTVQTHRKNMIRKLECNNSHQLIGWAFRQGVLTV